VTQITARLPDELVVALDGAASQLRRTRSRRCRIRPIRCSNGTASVVTYSVRI